MLLHTSVSTTEEVVLIVEDGKKENATIQIFRCISKTLYLTLLLYSDIVACVSLVPFSCSFMLPRSPNTVDQDAS